MVMVKLTTPDLALLSDLTVRASLPHLIAVAPSREWAGTTVQFAGDTRPTPFRGTSRSGTHALTVRYAGYEQAQLVTLLDLLETAAASADSRLLWRPHYGQVGVLNEPLVVVCFGATPTPQPGALVELALTLVEVAGTVEV